MQRLLLSLALVGLVSTADAQNSIEVSPKPTELKPPPYATITHVTTGPGYGTVSQQVRGRFHRVVVLQEGLVYDHPMLRIETLTYGDEGCCIHLKAAWTLDLNVLAEGGLRLPEAGTSELRPTRWLSPQTAEFRYGNLLCQVRGIGKDKVVTTCQ
jgi:hypothetical protein